MKPVYWFASAMMLTVIIISASCYSGYRYGMNKAEAKQLEVVNSYISALRDTQEKLTEEKKKIRIEYRDKVKIIHEAKDDSGCADTTIPGSIMQNLDN